jgi:hypothetical protein
MKRKPIIPHFSPPPPHPIRLGYLFIRALIYNAVVPFAIRESPEV